MGLLYLYIQLQEWEGLDRKHMARERDKGQGASPCKHGKEINDAIICGEFLE